MATAKRIDKRNRATRALEVGDIMRTFQLSQEADQILTRIMSDLEIDHGPTTRKSALEWAIRQAEKISKKISKRP